MSSYEGVAHFGEEDGVSERPLPLVGCASLRAASGRACVGSLRERSAPFDSQLEEGWSAGSLVIKHDALEAQTAGCDYVKHVRKMWFWTVSNQASPGTREGITAGSISRPAPATGPGRPAPRR